MLVVLLSICALSAGLGSEPNCEYFFTDMNTNLATRDQVLVCDAASNEGCGRDMCAKGKCVDEVCRAFRWKVESADKGGGTCWLLIDVGRVGSVTVPYSSVVSAASNGQRGPLSNLDVEVEDAAFNMHVCQKVKGGYSAGQVTDMSSDINDFSQRVRETQNQLLPMLTSKNAELEKGNSIATDDMKFDTDSQIGSAAAEASQLQSDIELMDQQANMFLSNATLVQEAVDKGPWDMEVKVRELMEKITKSLAPAEASTESALMGNLFSRAHAKFSFSAASGMNKVEGEKGTAERVQGKYDMKTKKTLKSMEKFGKTSKKYAQKAYRKVSKLTKKLEKEIKKRYKNFEKITKKGSKQLERIAKGLEKDFSMKKFEKNYKMTATEMEKFRIHTLGTFGYANRKALKKMQNELFDMIRDIRYTLQDLTRAVKDNSDADDKKSYGIVEDAEKMKTLAKDLKGFLKKNVREIPKVKKALLHLISTTHKTASRELKSRIRMIPGVSAGRKIALDHMVDSGFEAQVAAMEKASRTKFNTYAGKIEKVANGARFAVNNLKNGEVLDLMTAARSSYEGSRTQDVQLGEIEKGATKVATNAERAMAKDNDMLGEAGLRIAWEEGKVLDKLNPAAKVLVDGSFQKQVLLDRNVKRKLVDMGVPVQGALTHSMREVEAHMKNSGSRMTSMLETAETNLAKLKEHIEETPTLKSLITDEIPRFLTGSDEKKQWLSSQMNFMSSDLNSLQGRHNMAVQAGSTKQAAEALDEVLEMKNQFIALERELKEGYLKRLKRLREENSAEALASENLHASGTAFLSQTKNVVIDARTDANLQAKKLLYLKDINPMGELSPGIVALKDSGQRSTAAADGRFSQYMADMQDKITDYLFDQQKVLSDALLEKSAEVKDLLRGRARQNGVTIQAGWKQMGERLDQLVAEATGEQDAADLAETRDQPALAHVEKNLGTLIRNLNQDYKQETKSVSLEGDAKRKGEQAEEGFLRNIGGASTKVYDKLGSFQQEYSAMRQTDEQILRDTDRAKADWMLKINSDLLNTKADVTNVLGVSSDGDSVDDEAYRQFQRLAKADVDRVRRVRLESAEADDSFDTQMSNDNTNSDVMRKKGDEIMTTLGHNNGKDHVVRDRFNNAFLAETDGLAKEGKAESEAALAGIDAFTADFGAGVHSNNRVIQTRSGMLYQGAKDVKSFADAYVAEQVEREEEFTSAVKASGETLKEDVEFLDAYDRSSQKDLLKLAEGLGTLLRDAVKYVMQFYGRAFQSEERLKERLTDIAENPNSAIATFMKLERKVKEVMLFHKKNNIAQDLKTFIDTAPVSQEHLLKDLGELIAELDTNERDRRGAIARREEFVEKEIGAVVDDAENDTADEFAQKRSAQINATLEEGLLIETNADRDSDGILNDTLNAVQRVYANRTAATIARLASIYEASGVNNTNWTEYDEAQEELYNQTLELERAEREQREAEVMSRREEIADTLNAAPSFVELAPGLRAALPAGHGRRAKLDRLGALLSRHDRLQKTHERLMQKHDELGDEVGSALRVSGLTVSIDGRKGNDSGI